MSTFGKELIESAGEALAISEGKMQPAKVITPEVTDVAAVRKRLHLSQAKFTVRDWEQKRQRPDRIAANLLRVIAHTPKTVEMALASR